MPCDQWRECKWCGEHFVPTFEHQQCCDQGCMNAYNGMPDPFDDDTPDERLSEPLCFTTSANGYELW